MKTNNAKYSREFRERQRELGRKGRLLFLTEDEHSAVKRFVERQRDQAKPSAETAPTETIETP